MEPRGYLRSEKFWYILSATGDNFTAGERRLIGRGVINLNKVEPGHCYCFNSESEAAGLAERLASANPGTRYYVLESICGFLLDKPAPQRLDY
jgi:hypothetical protein